MGSRGRFRDAFDSFWNLQAELILKDVVVRMIALTATLRPEDVTDVMHRLSMQSAQIFRRSCFREGLTFKFIYDLKETDAVEKASELAMQFATEQKVLVVTSTVKLCDDVGKTIQAVYKG